uniref:Extracellular globin n=1 Tax=Galathealinum brachiosum TaxID=53701 RepID=A0A0S2MLM0_9ANNE|nr:hemoglobin subunit B2 [Galathealinum brachiosum]
MCVRQLATLTLIVACAGVSMTSAMHAGSGCCSSEDARIVQEQWSTVFSAENSGKSKITLCREIFERLFVRVPNAVELFKDVGGDNIYSDKFSSQMVRVLAGLDLAIGALHDQPLLDELVEHLNAQHSVRDGVTASAFEVWRQIVLEVMPKIIDSFNSDAWMNCVCPIVHGIAKGLP